MYQLRVGQRAVLPEIVLAKRKLSNSLTGQYVNCISDSRRDWRRRGFTKSTDAGS